MGEAAVSHVDVVGGLTDEVPIASIRFNVARGRYGDLDKSKFASMVRVLLEKRIDGPEAFQQSFGVIEAVDAESDACLGLADVQVTQDLHRALDLGRLRPLYSM